mmetsp:Transcript_8411/g.16302  ORF Transcript_8411/g.16302 Transcript_8411/m.16302 type:complete len:197 (-) Transcript_8411:100-690(-)
MRRLWRQADRWCARFPITWAIVSAGVKGALGDQIAQRLVEQKQTADLRRTAVYTTYSGLYLGGIQYFVQCRFLEWAFPGRTALSVARKVAFDQFVHIPFVAYPCLYLIKEAFMPSKNADANTNAGVLARAAKKYQKEALEVNVTLWKFWIPAGTIGFAFVPPHWRIPYNSGLSLAWTAILSNMQARLDSAAADDVK